MKFNGFSSFLIGLGAGAAVMLFVAPKSGRETRRYVRRRVDDGRELIERGTARVQDVGAEILNKGRKTAKYTKGALTTAVGAGRSVVSAFL